jgi:hypothetical protein
MKQWYNFLCLLILTSFASYGQNVYQHFSELNGMEDYNGNTNLLYRIYSSEQDSLNNGESNFIYLFNVVNKTDSVFQPDFSYYSFYTGGGFRGVYGYDFWEKDPRKFIACGTFGASDPSPFVERFDNKNIFIPLIGEAGFISISRQNDSLVYSTFNNGYFYRSTSGGVLWDTAGHFNAFSLSPYNDKILFALEGFLYKTTDGGLTKHVVDTIPSNGYRTNFLFYDKDTNYIYRTDYYYLQDHGVYKLLVSNNSGESYSWQVKLTSALPIYVSIDNNVSGSIYLATGRYIYHSTDFGNTFSLIQTFDRNLVGIYKKPASSKLYAATYNTLYEIDGSAINIIKQIPIDKEIFKFDPLDMGNKWTYDGKYFLNGGVFKFVHSEEVIRDTILENQQSFKLIRIVEISPNSSSVSYSSRRIDSLTGKVYSWDSVTKLEHQGDDLSINLGDTINVSRFGLMNNGTTSFDSLNTKSIFGLTKENHVYNSPNNPLGNWDRYSLTKDLGITYHASSWDQGLNTLNLKGAIIKGVVYGDTSFVIAGINDKNTVQPGEFVLSQNYPNPFNPTTTINYSIPKAGNVKLTVYNAIGSKVATIINEYKVAGNYSIQFNGSSLASGIYFYKIEAGQFSQIKKMILMK